MDKRFEQTAFFPAEILLPRTEEMEKWAVVACDQFTSQPEYWQKAEDLVGNAPSALRLVLPEVYLNSPDVDGRTVSFIWNAPSLTAGCAGASLAALIWSSTTLPPAPGR